MLDIYQCDSNVNTGYIFKIQLVILLIYEAFQTLFFKTLNVAKSLFGGALEG